MTPRRLVPVVLDGSVQAGDQLPVARVGELVAYAVSFWEADDYTDPDDPAPTTLRVRVEPRGGGQPFRNTRHDGTPFEQCDCWANVLHAEGFAAWVGVLPTAADRVRPG